MSAVTDCGWIPQTLASKKHLDTDLRPFYQARYHPLAIVFKLGIYLNISSGRSISLIPPDPSSIFRGLLVQLSIFLATSVAKC